MADDQKDNKQLQIEIREQLSREHGVDSHAIGIAVDHGLAFLSGHVLGATQRQSAEEAALRVDGVRAVIDELKVRPGRWIPHEADLAMSAVDSLGELIGLPAGRVKIIVRDCKVRLKGVVSSVGDKELIMATVRAAIGRDGAVEDALSIEPTRPIDVRKIDPGAGDQAEPTDLHEPPAESHSLRMSNVIVVGESLTDEGIPIRHAYHRDFPDIRGEGETGCQSLGQLVNQLVRAREHARECWQRDEIDDAIEAVMSYQPSGMPSSSYESIQVGSELQHRPGPAARPESGVAPQVVS
ncbi:BON domain-containing protein [Tundrisphaera lichenicola]|uniref:BON domain-containing protein n=1 Tax=Tundrisphaera lichenicola TaxID=2029860 RepID=UPI003EB83F22